MIRKARGSAADPKWPTETGEEIQDLDGRAVCSSTHHGAALVSSFVENRKAGVPSASFTQNPEPGWEASALAAAWTTLPNL